MAVMPRYIPWMFDDEIAWKKTLSDERYHYLMPFENFAALYQEHRTGELADFGTVETSTAEPVLDSADSTNSEDSGASSGDSSDPSQILDQDEIDALIASMGN
jgi:hypothetical protein